MNREHSLAEDGSESVFNNENSKNSIDVAASINNDPTEITLSVSHDVNENTVTALNTTVDSDQSVGAAVTTRLKMTRQNSNACVFLNCVIINARSLKNKFAELHDLLYDYQNPIDILCVCESWLSPSVSNSMLDPQNKFSVLRCDRSNTKAGGGVCVFINRNLSFVQIDLSEFPLIECICFDLVDILNNHFRMLCFYRAGTGTAVSDLTNMKMIIDCLNKMCTADVTSVVLGDLNCPGINWQDHTVTGDNIQQLFFETTCDLGFSQYVTEATRGLNILDIILCNDPHLVCDVKVGIPFSTSDHCRIDFLLNYYPHTPTSSQNTKEDSRKPISAVNWKAADWQKLKDF